MVFYPIGLSSVYHPYLVTTQLNGSNALRRGKIHKWTFNEAHLLIEMHSRWRPHEAGWENAKRVQSCHQGKGWLFVYIIYVTLWTSCWNAKIYRARILFTKEIFIWTETLYHYSPKTNFDPNMSMVSYSEIVLSKRADWGLVWSFT
jgi:hypothetical protein